MSTSNNTTDWNISTDIYGIVESLNNLQKRLIEDEDETTLALGIYGYITDTEAKKIQTSTIMTGELGNEMFPLRSKLTKNVLAHAIYNGITDINAVPAHMTINIGIKVDDLDRYMENNRFVFDCKSPIFVGEYEFHFDYDIVLIRAHNGTDNYVYSAHYDMTEENKLSNITDPYLKQPFKIRLNNYDYIIINALVRQCSIEETNDKMISDSIIDNKTYTFEFDNQIAEFDVYVTDNGKTTRITPILYGSSPSEDIDVYCWYLFTSDNTIRITFDSKSYIPGLNSDIYIKAYTTLGSSGQFSYKKIDNSSSLGLYVDISSDTYNYNNITCYMVPLTDSTDGSDRKTKAQLQKLIPKAALSRGSYTTETDVTNYFNLIDNENNRLAVRRKVDNNISRVWYGYFLLKDELSNIVPTNTITIKVNINDGSMYKGEDGRYVLPAGSIIKYNAESQIGTIIDEVNIPELYTDEYFNDKDYYYMTVYNLLLNPDPLYAAFYLTISNKDSFFIFNWVNEDSDMQFVANRCHFQRNLLTDQSQYKFTFSIAQAISSDKYELYKEEEITETTPEGETIKTTLVTNKLKTILVLYKNSVPYRWVEGTLTDYDKAKFISSWEVSLETDNEMDINNMIKLLDLHVAGKQYDVNYGYFDSNTKAVLYTLAKFDDGEYGRYDLDEIAPNCFNGYTVTNIYEVDSGLDFYENFTNVLDTKVKALNKTNFSITGIPCVGFHYMTDEDHATYLIDAISERKAYIEYCLQLLENNMDIDFKFFNTYGPSRTYTMGDKDDTLIGHVDINLKFRLKLKNSSDIYTKDEIITRIKEYIEDLYDTGDWHAPNMINEISNEFSSRIVFLEFMNYNDLRLGIQHILKLDVDDPHIPPEFLNVRNRYDAEGNIEPCIDIEIVS